MPFGTLGGAVMTARFFLVYKGKLESLETVNTFVFGLNTFTSELALELASFSGTWVFGATGFP
jgi:glucokinase